MGAFTQSYLPLGDLWLTFEHGNLGRDYRRELRLGDAVASLRYRVGDVRYTREVIASAPAGVVAVRIAADRPGARHLRRARRQRAAARGHRRRRPGPSARASRRRTSSRATTRPTCPCSTAARAAARRASGPRAKRRSRTRAAGRCRACASSWPSASSPRAARSRRARPACASTAPTRPRCCSATATGVQRLRQGSGPRRAATPGRSWCGSSPRRAPRRGPRCATLTWPTTERFSVESRSTSAPGRRSANRRAAAQGRGGADRALVGLDFQYGRYMLIASSRPGTEAANLQGIWNEQVRPPWSSNYTININLSDELLAGTGDGPPGPAEPRRSWRSFPPAVPARP